MGFLNSLGPVQGLCAHCPTAQGVQEALSLLLQGQTVRHRGTADPCV